MATDFLLLQRMDLNRYGMGFVTHAIKSVAFNSMLFMQINNTFESEIKRGGLK